MFKNSLNIISNIEEKTIIAIIPLKQDIYLNFNRI